MINSPVFSSNFARSPSSRRAWIEIRRLLHLCRFRLVALLAEGVDRNTKSFEEHGFVIGSPSSRRAWIEILLRIACSPMFASRPPRGGRG